MPREGGVSSKRVTFGDYWIIRFRG
jgi:hypothetical protein